MATFEHSGAELHYRVVGQGPPLVMIHGFGSSQLDWELQAEAFREHFTLVMPDLRGFGQSSKEVAPFSVDQYAEDLRALLPDAHAAMRSLGDPELLFVASVYFLETLRARADSFKGVFQYLGNTSVEVTGRPQPRGALVIAPEDERRKWATALEQIPGDPTRARVRQCHDPALTKVTTWHRHDGSSTLRRESIPETQRPGGPRRIVGVEPNRAAPGAVARRHEAEDTSVTAFEAGRPDPQLVANTAYGETELRAIRIDWRPQHVGR